MPERLEIRSKTSEVPPSFVPARYDGLRSWVLIPEVRRARYRRVAAVQAKALNIGVRVPPHIAIRRIPVSPTLEQPHGSPWRKLFVEYVGQSLGKRAEPDVTKFNLVNIIASDELWIYILLKCYQVIF